jgi:hypothetical protein
VTHFVTRAFRFDLPGNDWDELTVQLFSPTRDDDTTLFAIARTPLLEGGTVDAEEIVKKLPPRPDVEREIVRSERVEVGPQEAQDVSVVSRTLRSADYFRLVCVAYYDLELTFQWTGPVAERASIDARADRTLESLKFRRR